MGYLGYRDCYDHSRTFLEPVSWHTWGSAFCSPEWGSSPPGLESLESRQLLSITLPTISSQTVMAGAPLNVALNGSASDAISYSVSVSNSTLKNAQGTAEPLTTTVEGQSGSGSTALTTNPSLSITVSDPTDNISGTMVFQLFQNLTPDAVSEITSLVNKDFYNGLDFWRVVEGFM